MEAYVLPFLLRNLLKFLYYTNKRTWKISDKIKDEPAVYVFWHGELVMQAFQRAKFVHRGPVSMLNSHHKDGTLMVNTMKHFDLQTIRGSSRHGAVKALIDAMKYIKKGGSMAITPDGPKGPRHSVSNGVIAMSQKGDLPIIPLHVIPTKYWRLKGWDQLIIPKPFGHLTYIMDDPFKVTDMDIEEAKAKVKEEMLKHSI
jgi:lysophospholipid acyltransferase (LPLAT)-like uncharacterized protein